jgi:protein-tyrosine phosphatase
MIQNILIVCVGNICRSPMGEALFVERLKSKSSKIMVSSAGLGALIDRPADKLAQELMLQKGLDISSHRARQISPEILFDTDIIFTMTSGQQTQLECNLPSIRGRVHRIGNWGGYDVPDPYQRPKEAFEQALTLIEQGVEDWCGKIWN